ncbi:50S ribosomal protein L29 [Candidatus Calditenuaceae archaeon HR02]|nr:50S ribosomal protein L29 [Candidatus Calditenuaceae archaeon HR02]
MVREVKELREKSVDELREELDAARTELRNLKVKLQMAGQGENTSNIRNLKRRIARILTILNEKQLEKK